jgi:chromatin modification-related protein EAF6
LQALIWRARVSNDFAFTFSFETVYHTKASRMSTAGPSADAKKAQAAALDELEVAQRKKRALDGQLVSASQ